MTLKQRLSWAEVNVLERIPHAFTDAQSIADECGLEFNTLMSRLSSLEGQQLVELQKDSSSILTLTGEGREYAEKGTPEERLAEVVANKKEIEIGEAFRAARLAEAEQPIALQWAKRRGWIDIGKSETGKIILRPKNEMPHKGKRVWQTALKAIESGANITGEGDPNAGELIARKLVVEKRENTFQVKATHNAAAAIERAKKELANVISTVTPEMLRTGSWKKPGLAFEEYDPIAPSPVIYPGKKQPLRAFADGIREVFLEMGFSEIKGPIVESSFWCFDALYVPQDHPGREIQDTFYVKVPRQSRLVEREFVKAVGTAHKNGGKTGSTGWGYEWSEEAASRNVLRTHTTSATCRHLAEAAKAGKFPVKVFCIDRVYRNEAIDYKHLAEFHQVEGIIIDDNCTFQDLVGTLKIFYSKLGFSDVRVTPSFFPYTEPSAQVEAYHPEKKEWLELGGCGMFRAEVTQPLGITQNVAAWGLGLERPILLQDKLDDIRTFYRNDLDWIRKEKKK